LLLNRFSFVIRICMYVCMYVCIYACIYTYIYVICGVILYNKSKRVLLFLDTSDSSFAATRTLNLYLSMKTQKSNNYLLAMKRVMVLSLPVSMKMCEKG
jgi:hypothetical protein